MPFTFHEGLPKGLKSTFDLGIFHDPKHLSLQSTQGWYSFYIKNEERLVGIVHFHVSNAYAFSPYRSPFGSFLFYETVPENVLMDFVSFCENRLVNQRIKTITIKNQPEAYSFQKHQMLSEIFHKLGYSVSKEETSAILSVTERSFESGLHKSERKRLRKCRESLLSFEIQPIEQLQKIYIFLEACREEKGYALSMQFEEISRLSITFPERILLTEVIDKNQIVAANISIRVYDDVLYNFYHDHASEYDSLSPVVLLNEGLYSFCQSNNIRLLDLGTSNINETVNETLLTFKLHLGAQPSRKLTFAKTIV